MGANQTENQYTNVNKKLFDFAFEVISEEDSFYQAIQKIFEKVSLFFSLDRSVLLESEKRNGKIAVTAKWSREDDGNDKFLMESSSEINWYIMEQYYWGIEYNILNSGKDGREDYNKDIVQMTKIPVAAIQFPIMDGKLMAGVLAFESWSEREWSKEEIATLSSITKLISSYLLRRQAKAEMEQEYNFSKKAMDVQKLTYYVIDEKDYELRYLSHYAKECYPNAKYGQQCFKALQGRDKPCSLCPIMECQPEEEQSFMEVYNREEDSWYTITASQMGVNEDGKRQFLLCKSNVTAFLERVKGEDQLTGVMSYEKFKLEAVRTLKKPDDNYVLVFLGIQEFSRINDEYGYEIGDKVLRALASEIQKYLEEGELLCRIKGDDFAVLIKTGPDEKHDAVIREYIEKITDTFRELFPSISINCFCGSYEIPRGEEYISGCLDKAMKARKVAFKNIYETGGLYIYSKEFEIQEKEREEMLRTMKNSLKNGNFRVFFQPKVDINTNEIIGAEALVRLIDKEGKLVSPGKFIPLAEENGLIVEIDKFVYQETFRLMRSWLDAGKKVPLVSVNISRYHLFYDGLPEEMKAMSDSYGLAPEQIEIEITESIFFEDMERLIGMVQHIKDIGYVVSMDDFGAGFSTLSLMKSLPVDVIKLDGGFFLRNELDSKNKAVISAMMQLAYDLGFEVVSEGVETSEQVDFLKEQGGKYVQGYFYYKPMPAEEFEKLLKPSED